MRDASSEPGDTPLHKQETTAARGRTRSSSKRFQAENGHAVGGLFTDRHCADLPGVLPLSRSCDRAGFLTSVPAISHCPQLAEGTPARLKALPEQKRVSLRNARQVPTLKLQPAP